MLLLLAIMVIMLSNFHPVKIRSCLRVSGCLLKGSFLYYNSKELGANWTNNCIHFMMRIGNVLLKMEDTYLQMFKPEDVCNVSAIVKDMEKRTPLQGWALGELIRQSGKDGLLIVAMVLTFPFLLPVSIPGTSVPFGILIAMLGISLMRKKPLKLPDKLMRIHIQHKSMMKISKRATAFFDRVDRWSKPRLLALTATLPLTNFHRGALIVGAVLLMSPLPLPMSNTLPAYGVLFLALGMLRRDGFLVISGYGMLLLTKAYFILVALLGVTGVKMLFI
ncbi:Exopolysaccharide synthesis, ExoD [compost metagenome]